MTRYLLSKLGQAFVTVVLVMLVVFTLLRFMPTAGYFDKEQWKDMTDQEKTNFLRNLACSTHARAVEKLRGQPLPRQPRHDITLYPKLPSPMCWEIR